MRKASRKILAVLCLALSVPFINACSTAANSPIASNTADEPGQTIGRQMFSPDVRGDPYARTQWEASVQALESACRQSEKFCQEAVQARLAISRKRGKS